MPDRGIQHVNVPLINVSIGYRNGMFIWRDVLPECPVDKASDLYNVFDDNFMRYYGVTRQDKTPSQRIPTYSRSTNPYLCKEHTYNDVVTDKDRNDADPGIDPDVRVTQALTSVVDLDIEVATRNIVFEDASYATGCKSSPTKKWNAADSNPALDVDTARSAVGNKVGVKPNTMIIGDDVFLVLKRHPAILDAFKYTMKGVLTIQQLQEYFNIGKIVVGDATYISSKPGQTKAKSAIWTGSCALLYVPASPAKDEPAFGYNFLHKLYGGMTALVRSIPDEKLGVGGVQIEVSRAFDAKVTANNAGYHLSDVLAS